MDAQPLELDDDGGFPPKHMRAPYAEGSILPPPEPLPLVATLRTVRTGPRAALQGASLAGAVIGGLFVGMYVLIFLVRLWRSR